MSAATFEGVVGFPVMWRENLRLGRVGVPRRLPKPRLPTPEAPRPRKLFDSLGPNSPLTKPTL